MAGTFEDRPIAMYLHCRQCLAENARPQQISTGLSHDGESVIVWCNRHEREIATLALLEPQHFACAECEAGTKHRH